LNFNSGGLFSPYSAFPNKNWTGNYRLKSNGEIAKDHATKKTISKDPNFLSRKKKFQISFIEFYHVWWLVKKLMVSLVPLP